MGEISFRRRDAASSSVPITFAKDSRLLLGFVVCSARNTDRFRGGSHGPRRTGSAP